MAGGMDAPRGRRHRSGGDRRAGAGVRRGGGGDRALPPTVSKTQADCMQVYCTTDWLEEMGGLTDLAAPAMLSRGRGYVGLRRVRSTAAPSPNPWSLACLLLLPHTDKPTTQRFAPPQPPVPVPRVGGNPSLVHRSCGLVGTHTRARPPLPCPSRPPPPPNPNPEGSRGLRCQGGRINACDLGKEEEHKVEVGVFCFFLVVVAS